MTSPRFTVTGRGAKGLSTVFLEIPHIALIKERIAKKFRHQVLKILSTIDLAVSVEGSL